MLAGRVAVAFWPAGTSAPPPEVAPGISFAADGMPVGLQLVGPHQGDLALLNVAAGIETATDFANHHPEL